MCNCPLSSAHFNQVAAAVKVTFYFHRQKQFDEEKIEMEKKSALLARARRLNHRAAPPPTRRRSSRMARREAVTANGTVQLSSCTSVTGRSRSRSEELREGQAIVCCLLISFAGGRNEGIAVFAFSQMNQRL